jgi:beta-glucosidase-like glycosyl hydrolase/CubicO group peptidase (beta-lactamase class C family)
MKRILILASLILNFLISFSQDNKTAQQWADSVFETLSIEEKIAQLMIVRAHSNLPQKHVDEIVNLIKKYNIGGLCFFQGGPVRQAKLTNYYQSIAKTPLMITIDAEWGLGMRLDSVQSLPRQLMLGASPDAGLAYRYGKILGRQCKRMGIHVDYAPVVDINNNPANPVINDRSFGEDKYKVTLFGKQLIKGLEDQGVMACAKHFPGHGDTETDSHYDLPLIQKKRSELDTLELYPFKQVFEAGVGSTMVGHLAIPDIDATPHIATSISKKNVTDLLKNELGYKGLVFTDAIEMKGVQKFFPGGEASVKALMAGNDLLCLPLEIPSTIHQIKKAIRRRKIHRKEFNAKVKKVLAAKYQLGLPQIQFIDIENLLTDLNQSTDSLIREIAGHSITLLRNERQLLPMDPTTLSFLSKQQNRQLKVAYLAFGTDTMNFFCRKMGEVYKADIFFYKYQHDAGNVLSLIEMMNRDYDYVVMGLHKYSRRPANQFGIGAGAMQLIQTLSKKPNAVLISFGNPYPLSSYCDATHVIAAYEDHPIIQETAFDILSGKKSPMGSLPVSVCNSLKAGTGFPYDVSKESLLPRDNCKNTAFPKVDSIIHDAIRKKAMPGCVVLAAKDSKIIFEKAYGYTKYDSSQQVTPDAIYDLASVTKVMATTLTVMKLYEEGQVELDRPLGDYLHYLKGTVHDSVSIRQLLLHQSGLPSWIPFYKQVIDTASGIPYARYISTEKSSQFNVQIAEKFYLHQSWLDSIQRKILRAGLPKKGTYTYSDIGFIYLGKILEAITGMPLNEYVTKYFYEPLSLHRIGFLPKDQFPLNSIIPTEDEKIFRRQLLWGHVHDPSAAMMGGVAGHAGLFGSAYDLAVLMQMLMNGGSIGGKTFFKPETLSLFTQYQSTISRRGLGFDKPEKDNASRAEPYPCLSIDSSAFGHTGFAGTCVWADPKNKIVFILLSNRIHPSSENTLFGKMNIRGKVQEVFMRFP